MRIDPNTLKPSAFKMPDKYKINNEENAWAIIKDAYALKMSTDRVLVIEDKFRSRFDCKACDGEGHTEEVCSLCNGTCIEQYTEINEHNEEIPRQMACRNCTVGTAGARITFGFKICPSCKGKQAIIITPDESKRETTTGNVIALGEDVKLYKLNEKVLFTNYIGTPFKFMEIKLRILHEKDILCSVKKLKSNIDNMEIGNFAEIENTGGTRE
jgi:co-chaperonin GroES (HSP10)